MDIQEFQEILIKALHQIHPQMDTLFGEKADEIDLILQNRLQWQEQGLPLASEIVELLTQNETSTEWFKNFLRDEGMEHDQIIEFLLPGRSGSTPGGLKKYVCSADNTHFPWYQSYRDEHVPLCVKCHAPMVPV